MKTSIAIAGFSTLAIIASAFALSPTANAATPSPGPGYVLVEQTANHSDDTGQIVAGCIGFNHIVAFGDTLVCVPASSVNSEQVYDPDSGHWVLP